ncbi:MAG: B12-binding domain-containing radical SAM protein [Halanaerobiaceae bacterium]
MKVLLTTLNSKYIHSSLSLRYIEKYTLENLENQGQDRYQLKVKEFSINEHLDQISAEIFKEKADIVAFSCYTWNSELVYELISRLKKVAPELTIVVGGPEVSFGSGKILQEHPGIDIIIKGEGEVTFRELLTNLLDGKNDLPVVRGIVYRDQQGKIRENDDRQLLLELDSIPRPYSIDDLEELEHKIIYYESSRGCPFHCSYCLSSTIKGVRAFSLKRVKEDLKFFIDNKVKLVKFVDRTFNYDRERTLEIFRFLVNNRGETTFHFEITADMLDEKTLDFLVDIPTGLFQFEIGVQSTNKETLLYIKRRMDFSKLSKNVKFLRKSDNMNLHLDLIAGLPGEDYSSFAESFNDVYELNPHVLQLGFLKLLRGADIRNTVDEHCYKYIDIPPYEVLQNKYISYEELLKLKDIEFILDKYHNSGVFADVLEFIFVRYYNSYFSFFEDFSAYFVDKNLHRRAHSRNSLYRILYDFYINFIDANEKEKEAFAELLKYDLIKYNSGVKVPSWAKDYNIEKFNDIRYRFLESEENIERFIPHYQGERINNILKNVRFEVFRFDVTDINEVDACLDSREIHNSDEIGKRIQTEKYDKKNFNIILFDYYNKDRTITYNISDFFW